MKYSIVLPILLLGIVIILCGLYISSLLFIFVGSICIVIGIFYMYVSTPTPPTVLSVTYTSIPKTVGYLTVTCSSVLFATLYQAIAFSSTANYSATSTNTTIILPISDYGTYRVYVQAITPFGTSFYSSDTLVNSITITACTVSDWGQWSSCDPNTGIQTRTRTVITPEKNGGGSCPPLVDTQPCLVNCVVSDWSAWSYCDSSTGETTRTRTVITPEQNGGGSCPPLVDTLPCAVNCVVGDWSAWSTCSGLCIGSGSNPYQTSERPVVTNPRNGGEPCPELIQYQPCNQIDCLTYCEHKYLPPPKGVGSCFIEREANQRIDECLRTNGTMIGPDGVYPEFGPGC